MDKTNFYKLLSCIVFSLFIISCSEDFDIDESDIVENSDQTSQGFVIRRNVNPEVENNPSLKNALDNSINAKGDGSVNQRSVNVSDQYIIHTETSNYQKPQTIWSLERITPIHFL